MRVLEITFLKDLKSGLLHPFTERLQLDRTLLLGIRDNAINLYYRGGNLLRLTAARQGYVAAFDQNYVDGTLDLPSPSIRKPADVIRWLAAFPQLKLAMDLWFGRNPKDEREVQQRIALENNFGRVSRATDFYVCDVEYANEHGRFDIVAVHWPSTSAARQQRTGRRLVLGEVKYGDGALTDKAGLHAHVHSVNAFLSDPSNVTQIKAEMVDVFNQQRALGLVNCGHNLESFGDERPLLLLILANHDPDKSKLRSLLADMPPSEHADVRIVSSSLVGYGMFNPNVLTVEEALARHGATI